VDVVSLLPGTVAAGVDRDEIIVHTIDVNAPVEAGLRRLERQTMRLFTRPEEAAA
jgi:hypothetical protein